MNKRYNDADLKMIMKIAEQEKIAASKSGKYRINGVDSSLPKLVTVPIQANSPDEAVDWARKFTPFKPFAPAMILQCLQVWHDGQWRWIVGRD